MTSTSVDLLERIALGDEEGFMEFYDTYAPRALGLLTRILGDRTEAEDVLQELMLEIWRRASQYDARLGSAASWVLMMARSRAIDRIRQRGRLDKHIAALASGSVPTEREPGTTADSGRVDQALRDLPEEQRQPIVLAFYHGLSREEIARVQQVPVGTVKTRIRSGVQRLRELLAE